MDRKEFAWGEDRAKIEVFLKAYSPKPSQVEGKFDEGVDVSEGEDNDIEDVEGDSAEIEDEIVSEHDLSDTELEAQRERLEDDVFVKEEISPVQTGRVMEMGTRVDNGTSLSKKRRLLTLRQKEKLHVPEDADEPITHPEKVATEGRVEGKDPVDLNELFGYVDVGGIVFVKEDLEEKDVAVLEDVEPSGSDGMLSDKGEHVEKNPSFSQEKSNMGRDQGKRAPRCRPKTLVPRSKIGLKERAGSRRVLKSTFEYVASSGDEIVDATTGVSRRGVGYLFPTAPRQLMTKGLTDDDMRKLEGMKLNKAIRRVEKHEARLCGYGRGVALAACRERARRRLAERKVKALCKEKDALIVDIDLVREEAEEGFVADKERLENQVKEAVGNVEHLKEKLEVADAKLEVSDAKLEAAETEITALTARVRLLEERLAAVPSREDLIVEYKATPVYAQELEDAVAVFQKSVDFTRLIGAEKRKMTPVVVECCREFFRDDLRRSWEGFETFFLDWVRTRQGASSRGEIGVPP